MSSALPGNARMILPALERWCAYRDRSSGEMLRKAKQLSPNISKEDSEALLALLTESRMIDDQRFAESYVRGKHRNNRWGRMMIRQGLFKSGVEKETAERAVLILDDEVYLNTLQGLIASKAKSMGYDGSYQHKQKLMAFLSSKGYETELIFEALENSESIP